MPNDFIPVIAIINRLPEKIIIPIKKQKPGINNSKLESILFNTPTNNIAIVWNIWYKTALLYIDFSYSLNISFNPCAPKAPRTTTIKPIIDPTIK